jgi:hypothetical protein
MPSLLASKAIPLTQLSIAAASIGATYTLVGTFTSPLELATIVSTMDAAVIVSFDGVHDHQAVPIGNTNPSIIPLNFKANRMLMSNTSVYVKQSGVPTVGSLFISAFSADLP